MQVIRLPFGEPREQTSERSALRHGLAVVGPVRLHVAPKTVSDGVAFCAGCAAPIEFGAVMRGLDSYCSVECSLGVDHPA
jgi:hypothetical protein